jgi:paraquat-inducible protein A
MNLPTNVRVAHLPQSAQPACWVCPGCDLVQARAVLRSTQVASCIRCQAVLGRSSILSVQGQLAFTVAAGLFLVIGNLTPLVDLEMRGIAASLTLPQAIALTWRVGQPLVAILAVAIALVFPLALIFLRLYVLWPLAKGTVPTHFNGAMHALHLCITWSMVEVFLLSTFVAIVRSTSIATVRPGVGLFSYALVTLLLTALTAAGLELLWQLKSESNSP